MMKGDGGRNAPAEYSEPISEPDRENLAVFRKGLYSLGSWWAGRLAQDVINLRCLQLITSLGNDRATKMISIYHNLNPPLLWSEIRNNFKATNSLYKDFSSRY